MAMNLLFVEDEGDLRTIIVEALRDQGYSVTAASDGREAIAYLRGDAHYDMVVTDVSMPGGVSGVDVATHAATLQPAARVLIVSGLQRSQLPPIPPQAQLLLKPYRFNQLIAAIHAQSPAQ